MTQWHLKFLVFLMKTSHLPLRGQHGRSLELQFPVELFQFESETSTSNLILAQLNKEQQPQATINSGEGDDQRAHQSSSKNNF